MTDFNGTWNLDSSKSTFLGPQPAGRTIRIDHRDPQLLQELFVTKADGVQDRAIFSFQTTGEPDESEFNGRAIRATASWKGNALFIETWIESGSGETYLCDCWSLSPDGGTLVMEHRNDALVGQRVVLNRVS